MLVPTYLFRNIYQLTFICCLILTGCMVGPDFHSPAAPRLPRYTEIPLPKNTVSTPTSGKAGKSQAFIHGQNISAEWWRLFHSKEINTLITMGLANSPNLTAAYATLRGAQEALNIQIGNLLFPAFNSSLSAQRQRFSDATLGSTHPSSVFNLFNASVAVSYTLDLLGGSRRQVENYRAQVDYQQFQLIAAYLTLTSNIVTTAVTIASLEEQIQATRALIHAQKNQLIILRKQFHLGGISNENVLTQQTLVDQTIATLPPLEKNLAQSYHALSVLVGQFPNCPLPKIYLNKLHLPQTLPVTIPSLLVRQRPDVRASEAQLHSASALIGVATANLLPQFTITGNYGWEGLVVSDLFTSNAKVWSMMGTVAQPIFHGGALLAQRRQAIANYENAAANYKQTVLQAFQNVADVLRALETDARSLQASQRAENSAYANLNLIQNQYRLGGTSYLSLLNAQQQYENTRLPTIQAKALRYNDTVALYQALGGGWWNKPWCIPESLCAS